jgi:hypothetical protein
MQHFLCQPFGVIDETYEASLACANGPGVLKRKSDKKWGNVRGNLGTPAHWSPNNGYRMIRMRPTFGMIPSVSCENRKPLGQ